MSSLDLETLLGLGASPAGVQQEVDSTESILRDLMERIEKAGKGSDKGSGGSETQDLLGAMALLSLNRDKGKGDLEAAMRQFLTGPILPRATIPGTQANEMGFAPSGPNLVNLGGSLFPVNPNPQRIFNGLALLTNILGALPKKKGEKGATESPALGAGDTIRDAMERAARAQGAK